MNVRGLIRQLYVDLVRARSRVRVLPAQTATAGERPIFIIGVYRSGTTLLRYVLDSHPRIAVPPETNFVHRLGAALDDPEALDGLDSMGFDRKHVASRIQAECEYFYANYAASCGKPRWADKTPLYVNHLSLLRELFPDAQHLVIHRHPLDQIHSHTKGGTFVHAPIADLTTEYGDSRLAAAHYWVEQTQRILAFTSEHPPAVTLTYEQLCLSPRETINRILTSLGEDWSDDVLEFHAQRHDHGREAASIQRLRGFQIQTGGYRQWEPDVLEACTTIVRDTAARIGYGRDLP